MNNIRLALIQTAAGNDLEKNLTKIKRKMLQVIAEKKIDIICLPELFLIRTKEREYKRWAESIPGRISNEIKEFARLNKVSILAGSLLEKGQNKIFNTSVFFDNKGNILGKYRKIHLFYTSFPDRRNVDERKIFSSGKKVASFSYLKWNCGMSICYDLRFPELYRKWQKLKPDIIFVPSNFTYYTGKAHWESLLEARAIENQCYVVAPNQCGFSQDLNIRSYGHSMVVDPWGKVVVQAKNKEEVFDVVLNKKLIKEARKNLPALDNRVL